ncbi:MAG: hypothetical protein CMF59_02865 [Leptospiraceae bacterium]|nr:hypothetical protein [Leptospiraceae bacterium]
MENFRFTFENLKTQFRAALEVGYTVITCRDFASTGKLPERTLVNRVDIDYSVRKAWRLLEIFDDIGVKASFFVRLHAPEYNPFSFENYRILKAIRDSGHEIGYHSEIVDQAAIWQESPKDCLLRDIEVLRTMLDTKIDGVASHGGMTGLNNLDFWQNHNPSEFGLMYEAYDDSPQFNLFNRSFYISDSEWTRWKCYHNGVLQEGDRRSPAEHFKAHHPLVYMLIHSDTYFERHFYE